MATALLEQVIGSSNGRSGSLNYVDSDVQAVHERFGIPYQVETPYELAVQLSHSKYGIQVVEFSNGAICYGYVNFADQIPAHQTLRAIKRMRGVRTAHYISKNNGVR